MNRPSFALVALAGLTATACTTPPLKQRSAAENPSTQEVLSETARRSGLSESELRDLVANCDLNQQTLYFCAFRDFVARDLQLEHARAEKEGQLPLCGAEIGRRLAALARARDEKCQSAADEEAGEGSMNLQARAVCASSMTEHLIQRLEGLSSCSDLSHLSDK